MEQNLDRESLIWANYGLLEQSFRNQDLVDATGKSKQNVSNVLRELRKNNFIRQAEGEEDHVYEISPNSEFCMTMNK